MDEAGVGLFGLMPWRQPSVRPAELVSATLEGKVEMGDAAQESRIRTRKRLAVFVQAHGGKSAGGAREGYSP